MAQKRLYEAVWTLDEGPLESEAEAAALFGAVGEVVTVEPARYELNRRGQWRPYGGHRLMVDVLTQRTQLVTIVEQRGVDEGGVEVVLATGKQGAPPQAIARWRHRWPPLTELARRWERAAIEAFEDLRLCTFALRVDVDDDGQTKEQALRLAATNNPQRYDALEAMVATPRRALRAGDVREWTSLGSGDDSIVDEE